MLQNVSQAPFAAGSFGPTSSYSFGHGMTTNQNQGPIKKADGSVCWSWQDDTQWRAYDDATQQQIESAFLKGQPSVVLTKGPYFGASHRRKLYMIQFVQHSIPPSFVQINTQTHFQRAVMRTGGDHDQQPQSDQNENEDSSQMKGSGKKDNHSKWRPFYSPMTSAHFKTLKEKDKICNICFCDFEEKELFENQCQEYKVMLESLEDAQAVDSDTNTNNSRRRRSEHGDDNDHQKTTTYQQNMDEDDEQEQHDKEYKKATKKDKNEHTKEDTKSKSKEQDDDGDSMMLDEVDDNQMESASNRKTKTNSKTDTTDSNKHQPTANNNDQQKQKRKNEPATKEESDETKQAEQSKKNEEKAKQMRHDIKLPADIAAKIGDGVIIHLSKCTNSDHYFHSECIARWLDEKGKCCHCQTRYAIETGNQPLTGKLNWSFVHQSCDGYPNCGTIRISFEFGGGIQGAEHYHPGQPYSGDHREAFLPDNEAGREALELTKIAWQRRLIFTIGTSLTTRRENGIVWASIHFKTRMNGGQQRHGFPDKTYFDRFKEELKAKGITTDDLDETAWRCIKNGYPRKHMSAFGGY